MHKHLWLFHALVMKLELLYVVIYEDIFTLKMQFRLSTIHLEAMYSGYINVTV